MAKGDDDEPEPELPMLRTEGMCLRDEGACARRVLLRQDMHVQSLQVRTGLWLPRRPEEVTRAARSRRR